MSPKAKKQLNSPNFQQRVLAWFDQQGRKDLPWQHNKTPFRVWVSEIMLQQTQVSTVIAYFQRFMAKFKDIHSLAEASEDEVLHLWTGLGYYSRARNLHRTAKIIVNEQEGIFPNTLEALEKLPGIGRSTAGAILAIAFQQPATILDGNVKRVLTRWLGITEWSGEKNVLQQLWDVATQLTPTQRVADYTQAMMDLGATVCVRGKPQCDRCPLTTDCVAKALSIAKILPISKPRKVLPVRQVTMLVLQSNQQILLEKREKTGVWQGLWSLPEMPGVLSLDEIRHTCLQRFQFKVASVNLQPSFRHTFSHYHLDILPALITVKSKPTKVMASEQQIWYKLDASQAVGIPAPVKKILEKK